MIDETIEVAWTRPQHTSEYAEYADLGIKANAGPLIFVPLPRSGSTGRPLSPRLPVQVFDSFEFLQTYLYMWADQLDHEFWLGICAPLPEDDDTHLARSALKILSEWLDAANAELHPKPLPFINLPTESSWMDRLWGDDVGGKAITSFRVIIMSQGRYAKAICDAYEWMSETVLINQRSVALGGK